MALTDTDRQLVTRLREKGLGSQFGARGALEALRRFGNPDLEEQAAIMALLAGDKTNTGGDAA